MLAMIFVLPLLVSSAFPEAYTYGEIDWGISARLVGMGKAGFVFSYGNPAYSGSGIWGEVNAGGIVLKETRLNRVYDEFDNTLGEVVVTASEGGWIVPSGVAVGVNKGSVGLVAYGLPYLRYVYRYTREIRDGYYILTGLKEEKIAGEVDEVGLNVSMQVFGNWRVGIGGGYLVGAKEHLLVELDVLQGETLVDSSISVSYSGWRVRGGINGRLGELVDVGFLCIGPASMVYEEDTIVYPVQFVLGVSVGMPGDIPARVYGEICFTPWTTLYDSRDVEYSPAGWTVEGRFGVEHTFKSGILVRWGGGWYPYYLNRQLAVPYVGFGVGWRKCNLAVDMGLEYRTRRYEYSALVVYPWDEAGNIFNEGQFVFELGLSYQLK